MNAVLLSIIIATKDRGVYCLDAINTILSLIDNNCELVVNDNSADEFLKDAVQKIDDDRLIYNYNSSPMSTIHNYNEAISNARGSYLCMLGDDDCVTKDIVNITEWMRDNGIESVCQSRISYFMWPNDQIPAFKTGELNIMSYAGDIKKIEVQRQLIALLENGIINYQEYELPRIYHGIIKRSCIDKVKATTGEYLGGLSPDIYATVSLSCTISSHFVVDFPFTIAGACPASTTVASMKGTHSGELDKAPHFLHRGAYKWESVIPKYYSVTTIWAESALKALKDMGQNELYNKFNKYHFYVYSYLDNRAISSLAIRHTLQMEGLGNKFHHYIRLAQNLGNIIGGKIVKKIKPNAKPPKMLTVNDIYTLRQAAEVTTDELSRQGISGWPVNANELGQVL